MEEIKSQLAASGFAGDVDDSDEAKTFYSHDASLFEITPSLVVKPKDSKDVQRLVKLVHEQKHAHPTLSVTGRGAGTDMAGGTLNESIIVDFMPYMNKIGKVTATEADTQPGVYYRDFEVETLKQGALMPSYPASRDMCSMGGICANNSGGEKSLEFGKVQDFVKQVKVVFADGNEYTVKPLNKKQLDAKIAQDDFEGDIYKRIFDLCEKHYDEIKAAKPGVTKNSMGYTLWEVWDRESGIFDLTKLIVGSEGTLGLVTDITYKLVPRRPHNGLLVFFLKDIKKLGDVINTVLEYKPATFEGFDDQTLILFFKLMPSLLKSLGPVQFVKLMFSLIPVGLRVFRGIPKLILMVEFDGDTPEEVEDKIVTLHKALALKNKQFHYNITAQEDDETEAEAEKFWLMRRKSFQLLRSKVKDKHTAPFIDDFCVPPESLPEFLPKLQKIIRKYKLFATIAGHMGDGNFHVIPLMQIEKTSERKKILPAMKEVNHLVLKYGGSLSGEHNDGLVRGPWLEEQFGKRVVDLFREVKHIFDPQNIFNPHKKSDAEWDYSFNHIRRSF